MKEKAMLYAFAKYASFNVMGMFGLSCYILADTFFVAKGLGANGLAALNLAIPIYSFIHGSGLMFGMGGATKYAILKSQNEQEEANRTFTNAVMLALGVALVFLFLGIFFSEELVQGLGADQDVFEMSRIYVQVILLFAPMFLLNNVLLCFVRNDGAPQLSMMAMLTGSLSNIILDYIFIFPMEMGIFGAVFATGLAPIISMLTLLPFFLKRKNTFRLVQCRVSSKRGRAILTSGLPSLVTEVSSGMVIIIFNRIIMGLAGNVGIAAYGVIANLSLVIMAIYTGIAQGIQPLISSNHGLGQHKKVQTFLRYGLITMGGFSVLIYCGVFFGANPIASVFNSEQNPLLQQIAVTGLRIYFIACVFAGFNIIVSVYFTSTEYARPAHVISLLRGFLVVIPMAFLLSSLGGMVGVWCAFPVTEIVVSGIGLGMYRVSRKKRESV